MSSTMHIHAPLIAVYEDTFAAASTEPRRFDNPVSYNTRQDFSDEPEIVLQHKDYQVYPGDEEFEA